MDIDRKTLSVQTNTSMTLYTYIDIIACTVNMVICLQAVFIYSERFIHSERAIYRNKTTICRFKIRLMHFTGVLASMCGIVYSLFRLTYWFVGTGKYLTCDSLLIVGGCLLSGGVALILLNLFIRADIINRDNNKEWVISRIIAMCTMFFNVISVSVYLVMRKVTQNPNGRCIFELNQKALIVRYIAQTINHITLTSLFVYPLVYHIRSIKKSQKQHQITGSINTPQYIFLMRKSIIAMVISTLYTFSLVILVAFYKVNVTVRKLIFPLSIFDMALTIGCVCYASTNINQNKFVKRSSFLQHLPQRRGSYTGYNITNKNTNEIINENYNEI